MSSVNEMITPLRVLIVGCGNIAGRFDEGRPSSDLPYTHAGAYSQDGRFSLDGCVEPDENRRKAFMDAWGVREGFQTIDEALQSGYQFDVVSICSPSTCHANDLEISLLLKPKLIFCEKPLTTSVADSERLVAECSKLNILLAVNHTRRWDPDVTKLQADIKAGRWGDLRSVIGLYNKGILNNGSHMLDLLHMLLGPVDIVKVGKPISDFFLDDPTVPVWLEEPQGVPIYLACGHAKDYAIFELQMIFSHGVITMEDGGMSWRERHAIDSDKFKGYRMLEEAVRRAGRSPHSMIRAIDNIYRAISNGDALASTGITTLAAQRICEHIKKLSCELGVDGIL